MDSSPFLSIFNGVYLHVSIIYHTFANEFNKKGEIKMLSQERINANFAQWQKKLQEYNCYSERMMKEMGDRLMNAPFSMNKKNGGAYSGGMIHTVLYQLCSMGVKINREIFGATVNNQCVHPRLFVNENMLIRVLLLQHISKADMFCIETEEWKTRNGDVYTFNDELSTNMRMGERSTYLCGKYGIELTEEEFHAIRCLDKGTDLIINPFAHPLSMLVRWVNQAVAIENYEKEPKNE